MMNHMTNHNIHKKINRQKNKTKRHAMEKRHFDFLMEEINNTEKIGILKFNKKLLFTLLYFTGMRLCEAISLNKNAIKAYIHDGILEIYCRKTKSYRFIYLSDITRNKFMSYFNPFTLDEFIEHIHDDGIISKYKHKVSIRTAERWFEQYTPKLYQRFGGDKSRKEWGTHSFRTNYINQIIRAGDIDKAQKVVGHKNVNTTLIYYRNLRIDDHEIMAIIDKANF